VKPCSVSNAPPVLAIPPRPARPLSAWAFVRTIATNTVAVCDEELFEEPFVFRRYAGYPVAFVSEPGAIRRALLDAAEDYPRLPVIRRLFAEEIGSGTLGAEGETWRRHRRISVPLVDRRAIAEDVPAIIAAVEAAAGSLDGRPPDEPMDIAAALTGLATELLNHIATRGDPRGLPILEWLSGVPRKVRLVDIVPLPARVSDALRSIRPPPERMARRGALQTLLEERLAPDYAGSHDLLWRLAHAEDRDTGRPLPIAEMRDEAASLMVAGGATVRALTWIWYLLALHPEVEARLHAELDTVRRGTVPRPDQLRELTYTRQVLDEVMRLYPPIPLMARTARRADVLCGHRIPRGTVVFVIPWIIHRHRCLWADPDAFDPDRFAEGAPERPRLAYIPFSAGPRTCTGATLAITKALAVIATVARRYRFRLVPGLPVLPRGGITLSPRAGMWMTVERR
jgi:cytochrome P450